ncbi:MAG: MerC domain-containing protein [Bacteroidota bacterium]
MKFYLIRSWDRLGISLSILCAIHCLFFPLFISVMPLVPSDGWLEELIHLLFFLLIAPTVWFAVKDAIHRSKVFILLLTGVVLIAIALIAGSYIGELTETVITLIGSSLLIAGHWTNYRTSDKLKVETHGEAA